MSDDAPLILTVRLSDNHQARFDALREAQFPPDRNFLRAHVTLFHALPGDAFEEIAEAISSTIAVTPAPRVEIGAPYPLGRGVAYRLDAPDVLALRKRLAAGWRDRLTRQDSSFSGLHVTVQNKADPATARALLADLRQDFAPSAFVSPGLDLWRYRGGPWDHAAAFDFCR